MRVFTTQGFQPNDVEGQYCYLEDQRGHYVATIDIELGVIKVSANRSDYEAMVNVNDLNDQDYSDDIREILFGGVDQEVDDSLIEQAFDLANRND